MSIPRKIIVSKIKDGLLVTLMPSRGKSSLRVILAKPDLAHELSDPWADQATALRITRLRRELDHFLEGEFVDHNYIKPLFPRTEEVWEIRSVKPKPSIRILGRFAEKDVFIALFQEDRNPLGGKDSPEWKRVIRATKAKWTAVFNQYPPHSGENHNEYLSNAADHQFDRR